MTQMRNGTTTKTQTRPPAQAGAGANENGVPAVTPELPPRFWRLLLRVVRVLPQAGLSSAAGKVADLRLPRSARRAVVGGFARTVGADLHEAELPLEEYETLNAFFSRRLQPGARTWPDGNHILTSPVDGVLGRCGTVRRGRLTQAKGMWYSAADLLCDEAAANSFEGGTFVTVYLSPRHYHRVHAPLDGTIHRAYHIPGALLPVNAPAVKHMPGLFARNERLVCHLEGSSGRIAMVAVGAYNVGRISATFDQEWRPPPSRRSTKQHNRRSRRNRRNRAPERRHYEPGIPVARGDELMVFHLGSTVVLLFDHEGAVLNPSLSAGAEIRLGEPLAGPQGHRW